MTMFRMLIWLAIVVVSLTTCKGDKNDNNSSLRVSETGLEFSGSGGSTTVDVAGNVEWDATSDQSWCAVSPKLGYGNGTVSVTTLRNPIIEPRTARITVQSTGSGLKREIAVIQKAGQTNEPITDPEGNSLNVTPLELDFGQSEGTKTVQVTANVSWTAVSNQQWCTVSPASGNNNGFVAITVSANSATGSRVAIVTIGNSVLGLSKDVTVTQLGIEPSILISPNSKDIGAGAETINVTVSANVEFDVTPNAAWITVTQATAEAVTLQAQANTATASRTGTVTFKQKGGNATATLTINQAGVPETYITITPNSKDIGAGAETINITVSANVEFDVTPNAAWITVTQATAEAVTLQAQANTATVSRTGTVTFKQKGGSATATLTVNQAEWQPPTIIYVTPAGNDTNDGKSWNTALRNITTAIHVASAGGQVWVEEGNYSAAVTLKDGISVYGGFRGIESDIAERGTRRSTLTGISSSDFAMSNDFNTPTVIDGFTLYMLPSIRRNVTLNNCEFRNSINVTGTVSNSTISGFLNISGGKVLNCRITTTNTRYTGGHHIFLQGGRLEGCMLTGVVSSNSSDASSIFGNFLYCSGSGNNIINCTIYNVTSAGNGSRRRFIAGNGILNFYNNIVLPHNISNGPDIEIYSGNNVQDLPNTSLYFLNEDYSPMQNVNSLVVNKGDNSWVTLDKDILGNPRIQNGTVDIGAIESRY